MIGSSGGCSGRLRATARWGILLALCFSLAAEAAPRRIRAPGKDVDEALVPVHILGLRMAGPEQAVLLLADEDERRAVPIAIGRDQGIAIYLGKERASTPRPMTHDLMVRMLSALKADIEQVIITELKESTYYAEIVIRSGRKTLRIDARPSDAIALAVRVDAPIAAAAWLLTALEEEDAPSMIARDGRSLGLSVQALEDDLAGYLGATGIAGVLVASVVSDSAAALAGLLRGDILRRLDGHDTGDLEAYRSAVGKAGEAPSFDIWRDGEQITLVRP